MKLLRPKLIRITTVPGSLRTLLKDQLKYMNQYFEVVAIASPDENIEKDIRENEGVRFIPVLMTRKISLLTDLKSLWKLYNIIRKERPAIVHTHTPKAGLLGMIASLLAGVPVRLHTVAGMPLLEANGFRRKLLDVVEKITYICATKVYPNSFGLYDIILKNKYAPEKKLKVLGNGSSNGIDTSYFDPQLYENFDTSEFKKNIGIENDDFVFVFIGRLVKDKGVNELIEAFISLRRDYSKVKLLILGSFEAHLSPLKPEVVKEIETNESIIYVGYQRDVRPYLLISNIFVFPSYREGFPNVVLQAGAMGIPSIVSDINGCNEIITDGLNGLIIPAKDQEILRERMKSLMNDNALRSQLSAKSREIIITKYQRYKIFENLLQEYNVFIEQRQAQVYK